MTDFNCITLTIDESVATLTLNAPDKLNALSDEMKRELVLALDQIADPTSGARALLLTGAGRGFCAGADLSEAGMTDLEHSLMETYFPVFSRLQALEIPIIMAVNGVAAGAGLSLALHGDIIIAGDSASFLMAFTRIGLAPDAGASYLLPRMIGEVRARRMMLMAEQIDAETALDWGLVTERHTDADLMDKALLKARCMAAGPTRAYAAIREMLRGAPFNSYDAQFKLEARLQGGLGRTADSKEGVTAFLEKRAPDFKGA